MWFFHSFFFECLPSVSVGFTIHFAVYPTTEFTVVPES